jgi:hypothetical protein
MMRPRLTALVAAAAIMTAAGVSAYSTYAKWASAAATFYVNPANSDVSASAAAGAVQYALNVWNLAGTPFRYTYGGSVGDTATKYDNRNVVIFRNTSNGSALGTTYSWWDSSNRLLDSDVVLWTGNFAFFTGTSGCGVVSNAAYLEDVATHELGHALGLNHSSASDATMYPSYSYCSQALRTLASDDINGMKALYGASAPSNTPPVVSITSPANGATFTQGATISLAATATDAQDGDISSRIQWTDNGVAVGSGKLLSRLLSLAGIHTIVAKVTDNAGATAQSQVSITVTALATPAPTATLTYTQAILGNGTRRVYLTWTGLSAPVIDEYRNNVKVYSGANRGTVYNNVPGAGTYYFFVCNEKTNVCTNTVKVVFTK